MNDSISRKAAIDAIIKVVTKEVARWSIEELPSTDRNGHWIYGEHDVAMCDGYRCDRCGFFVPWDYEHKFIDFINDYHFCPSCGARMRGASDE